MSTYLSLFSLPSPDLFIFLPTTQYDMTKLGEFLSERAINQTRVAEKAGLSKSRLNQLMNEPSTRLLAQEVYDIALAIEADPCALLKYVCSPGDQHKSKRK